MADRYLREMKAYQPGITHIFGRVTIAGSGAPTLVTANGASAGIASITRTNAGDYTIRLSDTFNYINMVNVNLLEDADEDVHVTVRAVDPAPSGGGGADIQIICLTGGTATDPSNGSSLMIHVIAKNSSVAF